MSDKVANRLPVVYRAGGFVFQRVFVNPLLCVAVVAQLVEPSVVVRVVAGSSPVDRPISFQNNIPSP